MRNLTRALAVCLLSSTAPAWSQAAFPTAWTEETILSSLDYPWSLAGDGADAYLTEKAGFISVLSGGTSRRMAVETSAPIHADGGGGLLGMALSPRFAEDGRIYLYQTTLRDGRPVNRVIEARRQGDVWRETRVLLDDIPGHRLYNGGRIGFGPDGMLYVTTGWTENLALPRDPDSLAGKILRLTPDGGVPADNPLPGSSVWSLGHRNPQGLAWDALGQLWSAEHGQSAHDEINRVVRGGDHGWPLVEGDETGPGLTPPVLHSGTDTWAPSGIATYGDTLLVAALRGEGLFALAPEADRLRPVLRGGDRIRDVMVLDGAIYVLTTNRSPRGEGSSDDRLIRLTPDR